MITKIINLIHVEPLSATQKQEYEKYLISKKIHSARLNSLLGIFLFTNLIVLDYWIIPSAFINAFALNLLAILSFSLTFIVTFHSSYIKHYQKIIFLAYLVPSFVIEYSIYISQPTDIAYYVLFSAIIIVIMTMFVWAHLRIRSLTAITTLILMGLAASILAHKDNSSHGTTVIMASHLFFVSGAIISGVLSKLMRDKFYVKNFLLQHSLNLSMTEKIKEAEKAEFNSNHDQLTGLSNRRFAEKNFNKKLKTIDTMEGFTVVLLYLDLNGFKSINDTHGHDAGDEVLRVTAKRLRMCTPCSDNLVRLGGDEFLLCITSPENDDSLVVSTRKIIENEVSKPIAYQKRYLTIGTSIGIAWYPEDGNDLQSLIKISDKDMYKDKLSKKVFINRKDEKSVRLESA